MTVRSFVPGTNSRSQPPKPISHRDTDSTRHSSPSLFSWNKATWLEKTEGSAIRRIGFERWLRNIAIALGNAENTPEVVAALAARQHDESEMVAEHVTWALAQHNVEKKLETNDV